MKTHAITISPKVVATVCAFALAAGVAATRANASEWDQRTILTVQNQPLQIRQVVLDPGTYVLKLLNTNSARNTIQIYTANEKRLVDTVQGIAAYRPQATGDTVFTYWETPAGDARALRSWFYPGQLIGQTFPYPSHPRELMTADELSPEAMNTPPPAPPEPEAAMPAPEAMTQTQTQPEEPEQPAEPIQTAQNAAPEQAPAPAAEPAPTPEPQNEPASSAPAQMPKTASPFPLIGLCGGLSLSLGGLLRLLRSA